MGLNNTLKKNRFNPKVSIIIPVYNGSNYMRDAIDSALAQTYENIEIIVVNDGSIDKQKTEEIALSYGDKIKYFYKENGGVSTALNLGIEKMTGEYFSWLSHDDIYLPEKIEMQIKKLAELEDKTTILIGGYIIINSKGKYISKMDPYENYSQEQLDKPLFAVFRGIVNGCTLLIHKSHFDRVGMFDPNQPTTQDYSLWFDMMRNQHIKYHKGFYLKSRSHDEQSSKILSNHIEDSNKLWIRMLDQISEDEMISLNGSAFKFYKNTYLYLKWLALYNKAMLYACQKAMLEAKKIYIDTKSTKIIEKEFNVSNISELGDIEELLTGIKDKPIVLFYIPYRNEIGGGTRVQMIVANALSDRYSVCTISFDKKNDTGFKSNEKIKQLVCPSSPPYTEAYHEMAIKMSCLIETDILIVSHNSDLLNLSYYKSLNQSGIKTIAWIHEYLFFQYNNSDFYNAAIKKNELLSYANAVVFQTSFATNVYNNINSNGYLISNPTTFDVSKTQDAIRDGKIVLCVGRYNDYIKRIDQIFRIFHKIVNVVPDTKLVLVGDYNPDMEIKNSEYATVGELYNSLNFNDSQIVFVGNSTNVEKYYMESSVFLLTSDSEGFGMVLTEAACHGVPSVIFDIPGLDDIVIDGRNGYIVPHGDIDKAAEKIIFLLQNNSILREMGTSAKELIKGFDIKEIKQRWEALIDTILGNNSSEETYNNLSNKLNHTPLDAKKYIKTIINEYERLCKLAMNRVIEKQTEFEKSIHQNYELKQLIEIQKQQIDYLENKHLPLSKKLYYLSLKFIKSIKNDGIKITMKRVKTKILWKIKNIT